MLWLTASSRLGNRSLMVCRSYDPSPIQDHSKSLELMRKIDALHLDFPWMGSRSIRDQLARDGLTCAETEFVGLHGSGQPIY